MGKQQEKLRKTIKVISDLDPSVFLPLLKQCNSIYNIYVEWAFKTHSTNKNKAHKELYNTLRTQFANVPSALLQSVRDMALENIKRDKFKFKPKKSDTSGIRFDKRCCTLRGQQLTISTLNKRFKTILTIPAYFQDVFSSWKFTGLQLTYNKFKQKFFVCLNFQTDKPETLTSDKVLGIDRGIKNTIYCSDGSFVSGKARNKIKRQFTYNRKQLQAKGTRSAKRKLRLVSVREQRFGKNENHIISKQLVNSNYDIFVLEKLSNFSKKGNKSFRRRISNWSYYQLEMFLKYKAELLGKRVEYIEASYTSQRCSNCGYIDKKNRIRIDFSCQSCGFRDHADYNAAKNIIELWLSKESAILEGSISIEMKTEGQAAVNQPNVSPRFGLCPNRSKAGTSLQASPVGS